MPSTTAVITRNTITGSGGPGISVAAGTYTGPMTVSYNRIVDNDPHRGVINDAAAASARSASESTIRPSACTSPSLRKSG